MHASQARDIMNNKEEWNTEIWYRRLKDDLFEWVKNAALIGNNHVKINSHSWFDDNVKKEYLMSQLVSLDYSVKVENNVMNVSW